MDKTLEELATEAKRQYFREYRDKNREHIRETHREWRKKNPDRIKASMQKYWIRQAEKRLKEQENADSREQVIQ